MIVLALVFALQTDWRSSVPAMGWTRVTVSADDVVFIRPGPRPNLFWERVEIRNADSNGVRSTMSLVEVDCPGGRRRYVQGAYYTQPNLSGQPIHSDSNTEAWRYPGPGTVGADFFEAACD
jgi:hypothetical protein